MVPSLALRPLGPASPSQGAGFAEGVPSRSTLRTIPCKFEGGHAEREGFTLGTNTEIYRSQKFKPSKGRETVPKGKRDTAPTLPDTRLPPPYFVLQKDCKLESGVGSRRRVNEFQLFPGLGLSDTTARGCATRRVQAALRVWQRIAGGHVHHARTSAVAKNDAFGFRSTNVMPVERTLWTRHLRMCRWDNHHVVAYISLIVNM
ncbi:hypothetical protein EVAR_75630_1 [Eumeta japonica]|uniref:Uncharacterized protein n=1 Tax=Eumeta variegata TaxID=151549 RepID=A0A4C1U0D7_EUMVA|nr:hypothetical protein EVAR_75630_1 [Eumeta japonica]